MIIFLLLLFNQASAQPPNRPCANPPCKGGQGNGNGAGVPIDQGVLGLLIVGAAFGARKIYLNEK